jgi:hypothetical protein
MPCDGWECAEAYWHLVNAGAYGRVVAWWPSADEGIDGLSVTLMPGLASVLLHSDERLRVGGHIGLLIGARAALARREV